MDDYDDRFGRRGRLMVKRSGQKKKKAMRKRRKKKTVRAMKEEQERWREGRGDGARVVRPQGSNVLEGSFRSSSGG
jgi:hypothetical protein